MHIALGLRRKRDEIAATIAAYEARIDAARRDLAALDQAAQLFELEAECNETVIPLDRLTKPGGLLEAPREADKKQRALPTGQLTPPAARTQHLGQLTEKVARTSTSSTGPERVPAEFFYLNWP
jgi:hypothetical protein